MAPEGPCWQARGKQLNRLLEKKKGTLNAILCSSGQKLKGTLQCMLFLQSWYGTPHRKEKENEPTTQTSHLGLVGRMSADGFFLPPQTTRLNSLSRPKMLAIHVHGAAMWACGVYVNGLLAGPFNAFLSFCAGEANFSAHCVAGRMPWTESLRRPRDP